MRHFNMNAALRGHIALAHLVIDGAADDISGGAFAAIIMGEHEALAGPVQQYAAGPAQPFFQNRAGHAGVVAGQQPCRVELHHLHIAKRQPGPERHCQPVHRLVTGRRVVAIHGRPAAGCHQHRLGTHQPEGAAAHINHQDAGKTITLTPWNQRDGAVFLQLLDLAAKHLFHQPVDDLDTRQIALMDGAVGGLAGKGLLVKRAVGVAVKETANFVFQLMYAFDSGAAQLPGHVLIRQPFATIDRIHEVPLDRVAAAKRHIIAALNHAGAAAFSDQTLDRQRDLRAFRRALLGMQRGEQAGPARSQDQDVRVMPFKGGCHDQSSPLRLDGLQEKHAGNKGRNSQRPGG